MQMYLTDKQVAERFGVSRPTIWRWVKKSDFPQPVRLGLGSTRWKVADIENWERGQLDAQKPERMPAKSSKVPLEGKVFGKLTVMRDTGRRRQGRVLWECVCECGEITQKTSTMLLSGRTNSCGCLNGAHLKSVW